MRTDTFKSARTFEVLTSDVNGLILFELQFGANGRREEIREDRRSEHAKNNE